MNYYEETKKYTHYRGRSDDNNINMVIVGVEVITEIGQLWEIVV